MFLAHAIHITRKTVDLVDVEVVREFSGAFPDEFFGLPPPKEVDI